jgi:hypothetical protein
VLITISRPGRSRRSAAHSPDSRSGPTRLNLASVPSNVPWPIRTTSRRSPGAIRPRMAATARRVLAAVAAEGPDSVSCSTTTLFGAKRMRSRSTRDRSVAHREYCSWYGGPPLAPDTINA